MSAKPVLLKRGASTRLPTQAAMSYFIHEDALMWSRLQVLAVVQLATLSAAYYNLESGKSTALPIIILVIGAVMTSLVFCLVKRSEAYRDAIKEEWLESKFRGFDVPLKGAAGLRGGEVAWIIFILALIIDVVFALEIRTGLLGLFPCME